MTDKKRIMLVLEDDTVAAAEELKKELFYNTSYSEMYRNLIAKGIEASKKERKK